MGRYCKVIYDNDLVIKQIDPDSGLERGFLDKLIGKNNLETLLKDYLEDLNSIGIKVANIKDIKESEIIQEHVQGKTMIEYLRYGSAFNENWDDTQAKIIEIAQILLKTKDKNFRIDANLENFILHENQLILVDIFPPIYVDKFNEIQTGDFEFLKPLFIDIQLQFIAFTGYTLGSLTKNERYLQNELKNKNKLNLCYNMLREHLDLIMDGKQGETEIGQLLLNRLKCFERYFNNESTYDELHSEIKRFSLMKVLERYN